MPINPENYRKERTMSETGIEWQTVDFRPARAGWRAVYVGDDAAWLLVGPIAGWLIQEERQYDARTFRTLPSEPNDPPSRRVVAGDLTGAEVEPVTECDNFWRVLEPDEPVPTPEQARAWWVDHQAHLQAMRQLRRQHEHDDEHQAHGDDEAHAVARRK